MTDESEAFEHMPLRDILRGYTPAAPAAAPGAAARHVVACKTCGFETNMACPECDGDGSKHGEAVRRRTLWAICEAAGGNPDDEGWDTEEGIANRLAGAEPGAAAPATDDDGTLKASALAAASAMMSAVYQLQEGDAMSFDRFRIGDQLHAAASDLRIVALRSGAPGRAAPTDEIGPIRYRIAPTIRDHRWQTYREEVDGTLFPVGEPLPFEDAQRLAVEFNESWQRAGAAQQGGQP